MTTKRYLEQIGRIERLIQNKQLEAEKIRELCGMSSHVSDNERVQTSGLSDPTGRAGTELASLDKKIDYWFQKRQKIINQIDQIDDMLLYEVLTYRYVQQLGVFDIAERVDRSDKQVWRLIKRGHDKFEEMFGDEYVRKCE